MQEWVRLFFESIYVDDGPNILILFSVFHREGFCAHCCAGLMLLVKWVRNPGEIDVVRHIRVLEHKFNRQFLLQSIRRCALQKPDKYLRHSPLVKVIPAIKKLQRVLVMHPDPIRREVVRKYCYCKTIPNAKMILCDNCNEWYHHACVGMDEEEARAAEDWRCGYCLAEPDDEGNRKWTLPLPKVTSKRRKHPASRNDDETPCALGLDPNKRNKILVGPGSWDEIKALTRAEGQRINLEEQRKKKQALKVLGQGGHHVVDEMSSAGLSLRPVDGTLVDDLEGQGLLD